MKKKFTVSELIELSKANDSKAQSLLMNLFWYDVKSYVLSILKEDVDSEDVTIETFTKVFKKLELYNSDFDFKGWIISIAHNSSIDFLRKKKIEFKNFNEAQLTVLVENEPSSEELFIEQQNQEKLLKIISNLDEKYRLILELKYLEDYSIIEIAEKLNLTISNTKVRLMRARKLLEIKLNAL